MATANCSNVIRESLVQALETMAFMTAEESMDVPTEENAIVTAVDFEGPVSGRIFLWAGMEFAREFGQNLSGGFEIADEHCVDGLSELLNVTCGLVLPMVASSPTDTFDMRVPRRVAEGNEDWEIFVSGDEVIRLNVEGHPVAVKMVLR
ncbi:hypothetical protein STSP2_00677 [Anaerohalosphaera lusitana]|uniref:Chemotaxis phosphatase CheX-like domain-containing protein n=1 Tax=Anaerohalosphaera lusitana TaxID=1936003 RepID=A0A1U9NHX4_9BACT|nr:chemotaxis protein CheX [Anaerohalosphaera lusitana]AQT67529.1 hypothetical protein STSP2_00677 [Anaerohalosphaera lusitana]